MENIDISKYIDHTILRADAGYKDIEKLCNEAIKNKFASVCINSCYTAYAAELLKNTGVKVCVVVGFPLGACSTEVKVFETDYAVKHGADEIDMVINIGMLKSNNFEYVYNDIVQVVKAAGNFAKVKVIIETCLLNDKEKINICELIKETGAAFVKTSTGFSNSGATVNDVKLMKSIVGNNIGVKAAGGIKTYDEAVEMITAGANRIGTSKGVSLLKNRKL